MKVECLKSKIYLLRTVGCIARAAQIRSILTDGVAWSVYLSVPVSAGHVTTVSPAKTDEPTCDQAMSPYATITVATCYTRSQKR